MELNDYDCKRVGERISEEVRKYMENYYRVNKQFKGRMSANNSGNLKKLQQTLYIARGGKRIDLNTLHRDVMDFCESSVRPEWY